MFRDLFPEETSYGWHTVFDRLDWTGLVKRGLIKRGLIQRGLVKRGLVKRGLVKRGLVKRKKKKCWLYEDDHHNVQNSDVHKLAETLRAKINELDEVLKVIKTAPENKRCESYPRLLSESLEIRGKAKDKFRKQIKRFSTEREN